MSEQKQVGVVLCPCVEGKYCLIHSKQKGLDRPEIEELPFPGEEMFNRLNYKVDLMSPARGAVIEAYRLAQQDMLEAGYCKLPKDRPELREKIERILSKPLFACMVGGITLHEMKLTEETKAVLAKELLALIPDTEQIDAMLVEARRTAKKQERLAVVEEIKELCIPLELISSNNKGIALTFQDLELLKEEKC